MMSDQDQWPPTSGREGLERRETGTPGPRLGQRLSARTQIKAPVDGPSWIRTRVRNLLHLLYRDLRLARPARGCDLHDQPTVAASLRTRVQGGGRAAVAVCEASLILLTARLSS